jgi:hypothetical protein
VFDVGGFGPKKAFPYYYSGIVSFEDLEKSGKLTARQHMQIEHELSACPPRIDVKNIREYLKRFSYPLYFFDFESYQPAIPPFDNIAPFKQVVFQYSLDYIEYEGGPIHHRDFLAYPGEDPRRALALQMCQDIPRDVCIVTYNMSFEQTQIKGLAALYPDLQEHLMNIHDHIVDLEEPFAKRWYFCRQMQGRSSIKLVLPALFPDDLAVMVIPCKGDQGNLPPQTHQVFRNIPSDAAGTERDPPGIRIPGTERCGRGSGKIHIDRPDDDHMFLLPGLHQLVPSFRIWSIQGCRQSIPANLEALPL